MEEEDDDNGTVVQGTWQRKYGHVSEFDVDARWILYYPNDQRPQGSLRIVSHPDLPPGHLKSFVSIVTKRWPKSIDELAKTLENYGLLDEVNLSYYNGVFFKTKEAQSYYFYNNVIYKDKTVTMVNEKPVIHYNTPLKESDIIKSKIYVRTNLNGDEFSVVNYSDPISRQELQGMMKQVAGELEAYNVDEHVQTWNNESMDKKQNLEKLYNVKIFA